MKLSNLSRYAMGTALALVVAVPLSAQQPVRVEKDRVVREDPGVVERPVARVSVTADRTTLNVGESTMLRAETFAADDQRLFDRRITWRSENPQVVRVDEDGRVTAVSPGTATIVADVDGRMARTTITVTGAPGAATRVSVTADRTTLSVGETTMLRAEPFGADDQPLQDRQVTWRSENPAVATVDTEGRVTAVSPGTAAIVATVDGQTARTSITVRDPTLIPEPDPVPPPFPALDRPGAFYWGIGAGLNFPQGRLGDAYDRGFNVTVPFGWDPVENAFGMRVDLAYNRLGGRTFAVGATQLETSAADVWSAAVNGTLRLPLMAGENRSGPYVLGGAGLYHFRNFAVAAIEEPLDPSDPGFGQWEERNTTRFGWQAGAGFNFGFGRTTMFLESRYVSANTPGQSSNWVPVILGITF